MPAALPPMSFDRWIADVRDAGADRDAATWLADRYALVLVDEFQDTDRWRRFFGGVRDSSLITVGDPKQAIYRFRGADVNATWRPCLEIKARHQPPVRRRSAGGARRAWNGAQFGTERIRFMPVAAAPGAERGGTEAALAARRGGAAVVVNLVEHGELEPMDAKGTCYAGPLQAFVAADLARRVQQLLVRGWRPSDSAVLVNSQRQAAEIAATLGAWGIASTRARTGDVFATESADQWRILLAALVNPDAAVARAAGLGWFVGARPVDLVDAADIGDPADLGDPGGWSLATVQRWFAGSPACRRDGLVALVEALRDGGAFERVVAARDGDRRLADIEHAEVLVDDVGDGPVEPSELFLCSTHASWLSAVPARRPRCAGSPTTPGRPDQHHPCRQGARVSVVLVPFAYAERPGTGRPYVFNATDDRRGTGGTTSADMTPLRTTEWWASRGRGLVGQLDRRRQLRRPEGHPAPARKRPQQARRRRAAPAVRGDDESQAPPAAVVGTAGRWLSSLLARLLLDRKPARSPRTCPIRRR